MLANIAGMRLFLSYTGHLYTDFEEYAKCVSRQVRDGELRFAGGDAVPGQVTRKLRMLRAHGLIHKVPRTHRYLVSEKGRTLITAPSAAREANIGKLTAAA